MPQNAEWGKGFTTRFPWRATGNPDVSPYEPSGRSSVEHLSWDAFRAMFAESFFQGEHVTLIGATGRGKTTVAVKGVLPVRDWVVVMAAKPKDPLVNRLARQDYSIIPTWPPPAPREAFPRVVLWPPVEKMEYTQVQRQVFAGAMADIYERGKWCVYWPEGRYMSEYLGLRPFAEVFWQQGRTLKISFVVDTQRPRWIPLSAYDQATHLFIWKDNDEGNVQRVSEMAGMDRRTVYRAVMSLDKHSFLYINTREESLYISKAELSDKERMAVV